MYDVRNPLLTKLKEISPAGAESVKFTPEAVVMVICQALQPLMRQIHFVWWNLASLPLLRLRNLRRGVEDGIINWRETSECRLLKHSLEEIISWCVRRLKRRHLLPLGNLVYRSACASE